MNCFRVVCIFCMVALGGCAISPSDLRQQSGSLNLNLNSVKNARDITACIAEGFANKTTHAKTHPTSKGYTILIGDVGQTSVVVDVSDTNKGSNTLYYSWQRVRERFDQIVSDCQVPMINIDDFIKTDNDLLKDRKIGVEGIIRYGHNVFTLKKNFTDITSISVDASQVDMNQRMKIIKQCGSSSPGCSVSVYGKVQKINNQLIISAEEIQIWRLNKIHI